jgi:hypothetical protein
MYQGYYYAVFEQPVDPAIGNAGGICLARTSDFTTAGTWQVYASGGWVNGLANQCAPLANIGLMHESLSYNTYLKEFVLAGMRDGSFDGIYLSTSKDLINWSAPVNILPLSDGNLPQGSVGYPTLMDPTDTSMSFENTGQSPYLYIVLQIGSDANNLNVVRQQISFH